MKNKVIVYKNDKNYYLMGFDYASIFDTQMGIDSKICYYKVDIEELKKKVGNENIDYQGMNRNQIKLIRDAFFTEEEERSQRIKRASDYELYDWRRQTLQNITLGYADSSLLVDIDEEIVRRKRLKEGSDGLKLGLLRPLKILADELKKTDFNKDIVGEQIMELQRIYDESLEKESQKGNK